MSQPRVVILYDWLHQKSGGGERMLMEILELYPEADLITLLYDQTVFGQALGQRKVITSRLQTLPNWLKRRPQLLLPLIRKSVKKLPTQKYDLVIAVSSAWMKNIDLQPHQKGLVYCFSPARMLWDSWPKALYERTNNPVTRFYITRLVSQLRLWDFYQAQQPGWTFMAISKTVQRRISKFYHRISRVVYPIVSVPATAALAKADYYIVVSVLARYKQIDLAIKACQKLNRRLIIVGDGPDRQRLVQIAGASKFIEFTGRVNETDKIRLLASAKGFIFCSIEDFGIAPLEALACGTPVIALRGGGLSETITEGRTGVFYDQPETKSLISAIKQAETIDWQAKSLRSTTKRFSRGNFRAAWQSTVDTLKMDKS